MEAGLDLAREERPGPDFEGRLLRSLHAALRERPGPDPAGFWSGSAWLPAWKWAAAACLVLALGSWVALRHPGEAGPPAPGVQAAAGLPLQNFLPAAAFSDLSPPLAAAGSSFPLLHSNRTERANLHPILFSP